MKTILESLKAYFAENTAEKIERDWAESEKYDKVGPTVNEFFSQSKIYHKTKFNNDSVWSFSNNQILKNPNFASDFFLP